MSDKWAFLTVLVPQSLVAEYYPKAPPIRLEVSEENISFDLQANGRARRVPAGVVTVKATAKSGAAANATLELREGESRTYRFRDHQFSFVRPNRLAIATRGGALPGTSGAFFVRFLHGLNRRRIGLTHVISRARDGGLSVTFAGEPLPPLVADVVVPGRSRALLSMEVTPGPGAGYTTARLAIDRRSVVATMSGDQRDAELSAARQFASVGNTSEAMRLVEPYVAKYVRGTAGSDMEAVGVAYILIRSGQTESLYPWALDLWRSKRLAADGLVIAAEWFGQSGCHLTALDLLRELAETGIPLFTDGYSLAVARLAAYGTSDGSGSELRPREPEAPFGSGWESKTKRGMEACAPVARSRGQELREWDRQQARAAHRRIANGIEQVDWSAYLVRATPRPTRALPRVVQTALEWLETRFIPDWTRVAWHIDASEEMEEKQRSAT
jgi:hypothetical protein